VGGRLANKTAIVTGAGQGIGREIARVFAAEGARVAVADVAAETAAETVASIAAEGGTAAVFVVDVSAPEHVDQMVADVVAMFGGVDVLVNNAGTVVPGAAQEMTDDAWDRCVRINLSGTFYCARAVLRRMLAGAGGSIVNISSSSAFHPVPQRAAYAAAKAGVYGFTRSVALDCASKHVRVNAIAPGAILTPLLEARFTDPSIREEVLSRIPMGRFGRTADIARVALFLASSDSDYVTGQVIIVDGGASIP